MTFLDLVDQDFSLDIATFPDVSVIVPTYNQKFLSKLLDALCEQSYTNFEILVVENGEELQTTKDIVTQYARKRLQVRYIFSNRRGSNIARNLGCRNAQAQIIALTDDDCIPDENWIANIVRAHKIYPDAGAIGGRVELEFPSGRPDWLQSPLTLFLAEQDELIDRYTEKDRKDYRLSHTCWEVDIRREEHFLVSANLSFKKKRFAETGGMVEFEDHKIDNNHLKVYTAHDETTFIFDLRHYGDPGGVYDTTIQVKHIIPPSRLELGYLENIFYATGFKEVFVQNYVRVYMGVEPQWVSEAQALKNTLLLGCIKEGERILEVEQARHKISHEPTTRIFIEICCVCYSRYLSGICDGIKEFCSVDGL